MIAGRPSDDCRSLQLQIHSALNDFKEQNNEALRQTLYKATEGLEQTCHYAKNRLNNQDTLYFVICYVAGLITALLGMYIWNGEQLSKIENNQLQMIREVAALRPKISKPIVKHKRKVATQKNDVLDEESDSRMTNDKETQ